MSKKGENPLLNVLPFAKTGASNRGVFISAEEFIDSVKREDKLPEGPPDVMPCTDEQKRIFNYLRIHGMAKGIHKESDAVCATMLAKAIARSLRYERFLDLHGDTYSVADMLGNLRPLARPEVAMLRTANAEIVHLVKLLSLHPGARKTLVPLNRRLTADVNRWSA